MGFPDFRSRLGLGASTVPRLEELQAQEAERFFPRAWLALREGVAEGVAPGMVAGVWSARQPAVFQAMAVGRRRVFPTELPELPMLATTPFDLASITKVVATATLCARLVERGWVDWSTPLRALLPGFADGRVTLEHLLSHTAGLPAWAPLYGSLRAELPGARLPAAPLELRQRLLREGVLAIAAGERVGGRPPQELGVPGARAVYSDLSFLLLGFALEEVTGLTLDRAVARWVWEPLGIRALEFRRVTCDAQDPRARDDRFAATELCPWRGAVLQGQVHDDNCWAMGGYGGHAGVFGPVAELIAFGAGLFRGFLSPRVLERFWSRVEPPIGPPGCERARGWDTPSGDSPSFAGGFSPRSVGHLGFTGTSLWLDPEAGLVVALLTNRVHPTRENGAIRGFRQRFHRALADDLRA